MAGGRAVHCRLNPALRRHLCEPLLKGASSRAEDHYDMIGLALPAHQSAQWASSPQHSSSPFSLLDCSPPPSRFHTHKLFCWCCKFLILFHAVWLQRAFEAVLSLTSKRNLNMALGTLKPPRPKTAEQSSNHAMIEFAPHISHKML